MESSKFDEVTMAYERIHEAMLPLVKQHVVSIAAYYDGELRQHATGMLVRFSDHHLLITAAHAIEQFDKGRGRYPDLKLFVDNGNANDVVPLYGDYRATQKVRDPKRPRLRLPGERDDLWDIGVWDLDTRTVSALTTKKFLTRPSISVTDDLTSGVFYLAGCPCSWAQKGTPTQDLTWSWLRYVTHPHSEPDRLLNYDERFHLALNLGDDSQLPGELEGISGCPMWKLSDLPIREDWTVDQARVVAVQTGVYSRTPKAICGTRWSCVLPVLTSMHPEIRDGFNIWLPYKE